MNVSGANKSANIGSSSLFALFELTKHDQPLAEQRISVSQCPNLEHYYELSLDSYLS